MSLAVASFDAPWAASLAPDSEVELPAGTYAGPWKLAPGVHLTAGPGAILKSGAGADATLTLAGDGRVEGLTIEVPPGGYGVRIGGGKAVLVGVHLKAGRAAKAAIYVGHGEVTITRAQIEGLVDYGVLAEEAQRLTVSDTSLRGRRAGVAAVSSPTVIDGCTFVGPFSEAAISLIHSPEAHLARNVLSSVKTMGIKLINSTATLSRNRVTGGRADAQGLEGNSLYADNSHLTLASDQLGDPGTAAQGPIVMLLHSTARLDGVLIQGALQSLIYVADGSALTVSDSELRGAPVGLAVEEGSSASEAGFRFVSVTRHLMRLAQ